MYYALLHKKWVHMNFISERTVLMIVSLTTPPPDHCRPSGACTIAIKTNWTIARV